MIVNKTQFERSRKHIHEAEDKKPFVQDDDNSTPPTYDEDWPVDTADGFDGTEVDDLVQQGQEFMDYVSDNAPPILRDDLSQVVPDDLPTVIFQKILTSTDEPAQQVEESAKRIGNGKMKNMKRSLKETDGDEYTLGDAKVECTKNAESFGGVEGMIADLESGESDVQNTIGELCGLSDEDMDAFVDEDDDMYLSSDWSDMDGDFDQLIDCAAGILYNYMNDISNGTEDEDEDDEDDDDAVYGGAGMQWYCKDAGNAMEAALAEIVDGYDDHDTHTSSQDYQDGTCGISVYFINGEPAYLEGKNLDALAQQLADKVSDTIGREVELDEVRTSADDFGFYFSFPTPDGHPHARVDNEAIADTDNDPANTNYDGE